MPAKFTYFPLTARGLPPLLCLEVGGVDYEPETVQFADWGAYKASGKCPFGYLPLLTLADGTAVNETTAMVSAAGRLGGLAGATDKDFAVSEMLNAKAGEFFTEGTKNLPSIMTVKDWTAEKTEEGKKWIAGGCAQVLGQFDALCKDGKFTDSGKTPGELHLFSTLHQFKGAGVTLPAGLQAFYDRLASDEAVKRCIGGTSKMGEQGAYLVPYPVRAHTSGLSIGSRVQLEFVGQWYDGTVLAFPDNAGDWKVACDINGAASGKASYGNTVRPLLTED